VVVVEDEGKFECCNCEEILLSYWPDVANDCINILNHAVLTALGREDPTISASSSTSGLLYHSIVRHASQTSIVLHCDGESSAMAEIADALAWACTALRRGTKGVHSFSELVLHARSVWPTDNYLLLTLPALDNISFPKDKTESLCWTHLFDSMVITRCPIKRAWGIGLGISFERMVHLAAVENYYRVDEGIVLLGFFTALIPISIDPSGNNMQWHLEYVENTDGKYLRPADLESTKGEWYKSTDTDIFQKSRCYLGWCNNANILLGTAKLVTRRIRPSEGNRERFRTLHRDGFQSGPQISTPILPAGGNLMLTSRFYTNTEHFSGSENYVQALRLGSKNVSLLIDSASKQGWLVPQLSLILHLCHYYFEQNKIDGDGSDPIPFAEVEPDGSSAVIKAIQNEGSVKVFGANEDSETLRQLFLRINTALINSASTFEPATSTRIFARELVDIVCEPPQGAPLKELRVSGGARGWYKLSDKVASVLVCSNIGDAIKPAHGQDQCRCHTLPSDRYYLAAHMKCMSELCRRAEFTGGIFRLGKDLYWPYAGPVPPIEDGNRAHVCIWDSISEFCGESLLSKTPTATSQNFTPILDSTSENGAVVFTGGRRSAIRDAFEHLRW
jgi:hypothetical protein